MKFDKCLLLLLTVLLAASSGPSFGYGDSAHTNMSTEAVNNTNTLSTNLPFSDWAPLIDIAGSTGSILTLQFKNSKGKILLVRDLIAGGAVDEDYPPTRVLNHFFDPVNNAQLTDLLPVPIPLPLAFISTSPAWAINGRGQGVFARSFSYADARNQMLLGLTAQSPNDRNTNLGLMFETLGHVIHHLQDMAQPQHVRNESHLNISLSNNPYSTFNLPSYSRYEAWAEVNAGSLNLDGYQIDLLTKPMDYWSVRDPNSPLAFGGLADFTNVNFVSPNRMFSQVNNAPAPDPFYEHPVPLTRDPPVPIESILSGPPFNCPPARLPTTDARCSLTGSVVDFVTTAVTDSLQPETNDLNRRAAMWSVFDQDLLPNVDNPSAGHYTVNALTFPNAAQELIPRAVGYSAGLIDYFFRGKIDITGHALPDGTTVPGAFDFVNLGDEPLTGTVQLYYDDANNNRYPVVGTGTEWPMHVNLSAMPLPNSSDMSNRVVIPAISGQSPPPATPDVYMAVFSGTMGAEEPIGDGPGAVVAKEVKLPLPEVYWSANGYTAAYLGPVPPPGNYGSASISFIVPPKQESFFTNGYATTRVKINGQDNAPPGPLVPQVGACAQGGPPIYFGAGGPLPDQSMSVDWAYATLNQVGWIDSSDGEGTGFGTTDQFVAKHQYFHNVTPACATQFQLLWINANQNISVELLIGTQSVFKFCLRVDPAVIDPWTARPMAFVSHIRGFRLIDLGIGDAGKAVDIVQDPLPTSCPGY
jgi:hypothetical protein